MKHIWAILIGIITTVFGLSVYTKNWSISVYVLLFLMLAIMIGSKIILGKTKKHQNTTFYIISLIFISVWIFAKFFKFVTIDEYSITSLVYLVLMWVFANKVQTVEQNGLFGIRTPLTLEFKEVWDKTNQFYSIAITGFIPLIIALIFWLNGWLRFGLACLAVVLPIVIAMIYSSIIGSKYAKEARNKESEELKIQEEIEEGVRRNFNKK